MNAEKDQDIEPYCQLRIAQSLFQKQPDELTPQQMDIVRQQASKEYEIETRILASQEAIGVIITEQAIDNAYQQIKSRFDDDVSFKQILDDNYLDEALLKQALHRQCKVENILEKVASRASTVSDVEVGIYYHMHPEKFKQPEQRGASHILITINDDFAENKRDSARQRIEQIADKLKQKPKFFADLAMKNSECPTAVQNGELGTFKKGQLYPEIEKVLFRLKEGQISDIVETEAGFHIVKCGKIHPSKTISFKNAKPKIRKVMQENARKTCQKAWIASLKSSTSTPINDKRRDYG